MLYPDEPTPWKQIYLLDDAARVDLRKTSSLTAYLRAISMDFAQRFPVYASGTQHNMTSLGRRDWVRWSDNLLRETNFESGWEFQFHVERKEIDPYELLDYLRTFDVHVSDIAIESSFGGNYRQGRISCYMFAADFPVIVMYRRMAGLDGEPGPTKWTTREGSF